MNRFDYLETFRKTVIAIIIGQTAIVQSATATDYYISPNGSDEADGLSEKPTSPTTGPFRTLFKAQLSIRALKKTGQFSEPITVHVSPGIFDITESLIFDARDSGTTDKPILWQGASRDETIITAGKSLACSVTETSRLICEIPKTPLSAENTTDQDQNSRLDNLKPGFQIYINDTKLTLARWPNEMWAHIKQPTSTNLSFQPYEPPPFLDGEIDGLQTHIFPGNGWYDEYLDVANVNQTGSNISLKYPTKYPLQAGRQFILQNHRSLLDAPGEWYLNSNKNTVEIIPPINSNRDIITMSFTPNILSINGANNLKFSNFTFVYSRKSAITVNKSHFVVFGNVDIHHAGTKAIDVNASDNIRIENSVIHDTGGAGVTVDGGDLIKLAPSRNIIENNHFFNISTNIFTSHPAILVSGVGTTISHNLIERSSNIGVMIYGNNHTISGNELNHLCLDCADCGAIYSGGNWSSRGNLIKHNFISDIMGYGLDHVDQVANTAIYKSPVEGRGIYIDNGSSGFDISNNILINPGEIGIHINGGRDNRIRNNYIETNQSAVWILNREKRMDWTQLQERLKNSPHTTKVWKNAYPDLAKPMNNYLWPENNEVSENILISTNTAQNSIFIRYEIPMKSTSIYKNLIWSQNSQPVNVRYQILDEASPYKTTNWQDWIKFGTELDSIYADPCATLQNKSLQFCETSPAKKLNFINATDQISITNSK
ncbi:MULTISPECIES: right-handed parallel beta-helix repeat-containing protein [Methylomonas]|uniref:Right handed beta helix domain-containing protein n=1 Tax=Methylomonas koyamae TaxID=702114 RepID=A0A177PG47_9GAMM|nr:right-handed parallel beta-helix repeat-containing protein [Methylomonas koyamae]OAI28340.1 hypothetical protein A1355_01270 [Methylomonas koyamae]